jgi:hypothetical protein
MTDLEARLRGALNDLARAVPQSPHARTDFERRLAQKQKNRWRATMLTAAAAVLVLVAVSLPAIFSSGDRTPEGQGLPPTAPTTSTSKPSWQGTVPTTPDSPSGYVFAGPIELGRFTEDGVDRTAVMQVEQVSVGERMCVMVVPGDGSHVPGAGCVPVPTWPTGPENVGYVMTNAVLPAGAPDTGPLPHLLLCMTAPQVASLDVRRGDGGPVEVVMLAVSPAAKFYLADFQGPTGGFGYTATDSTGNVLETAIT